MTDSSLLATSSVVTTVFDDILAAVHEGRLRPGQRISDIKLAEEMGISRTPVREALQRLREIGIIEASPNRFTRVAVITPHQTADAMVVWLALYGALVTEVVPNAPRPVLAAMRADHAALIACRIALDLEGLATANLSFFSHLVSASSNLTLQRAIISVVHIVRLGSLHLPERVDFAALERSQKLLIEAVDHKDLAQGRAALEILATIVVPQEVSPFKALVDAEI